MSSWTAVTIGWLSVIGGLGAYAASILWRSRRVAARVAPERRRWMGSE
jgi:hypothetical protein